MSVLALQHSPVADVLDPVSKRTAGLPRISRGTINDARLVSCGEVRITATIYIVAGADSRCNWRTLPALKLEFRCGR
jgi:hypothetical protein